MEILGLDLPWWLTLLTFFGLLLALMSTGMPVAIAQYCWPTYGKRQYGLAPITRKRI